MKKGFLVLMAVYLMTATAFSQKAQQNVAKECVLFEVFTGVNCPYCPAAANGIGQMMDEGLSIAPLAYHTSAFSTAEFYTTETNARANFYSITSYPTLKADGIQSVSGGGSASQNMYSTYLSKYNQRINITSPYTIDLSYSHLTGTANYQVVCTVNQVGESAGSNLKIMIAVSQCNIQKTWQGMSSLHHVVRDMIPTQTGTVYSGGTQTVTEVFTLGALPQEDCWITAWVQDFSSKEVFQAVRVSMDAADYPNDIMLNDVSNVITHSCSGKIEPTVVVKNRGIFDITSFDVAVKVGGVEQHRYHWEGDGFAYGETKEVAIPEFAIMTSNETMDVEFVVENPNGLSDPNLSGNSMTESIEPALVTSNFINIIFISDSKPYESRLEIINMNSNEIIQTYTFDDANTVCEFTVDLPEISCYQIALFDEGGDGLNKQMGVFDNDGNLIFSTGQNINQFTSKIAVEIVSTMVENNEISDSKFVIAPNPSQGKFQITTNSSDSYPVVVYDVTGKEVYQNARFNDGIIDLSHCTKGVYLIKVGTQTKKIIIY